MNDNRLDEITVNETFHYSVNGDQSVREYYCDAKNVIIRVGEGQL